ncbi:Uncharacterised protein [Pragia fontium]|nr:Uncharacterised protein [Pragia fontium]
MDNSYCPLGVANSGVKFSQEETYSSPLTDISD